MTRRPHNVLNWSAPRSGDGLSWRVRGTARETLSRLGTVLTLNASLAPPRHQPSPPCKHESNRKGKMVATFMAVATLDVWLVGAPNTPSLSHPQVGATTTLLPSLFTRFIRKWATELFAFLSFFSRNSRG